MDTESQPYKQVAPQPVTDFLMENYGFEKFYSNEFREPDYEQFSCVLRIHVLHYLYFSEKQKHFSIGVKHDKPKGKPGGGGVVYMDRIMIPKVINTIEDACKLIEAIVDFKSINLYPS